MTVLEEKMALAHLGRGVWRQLQEKYALYQNPLFVLLYEEHPELLGQVASHLPSFVEKKGYDVSVLLGRKEGDFLPIFQETKDVFLESLQMEELEGVLSLYEMYEFTSSLRIVSLHRPFGSKLQQIPFPLETVVDACLFH